MSFRLHTYPRGNHPKEDVMDQLGFATLASWRTEVDTQSLWNARTQIPPRRRRLWLRRR